MILVMIAMIFVTNVLGRHWDFAVTDKVSQPFNLLFRLFGCLWLTILPFVSCQL